MMWLKYRSRQWYKGRQIKWDIYFAGPLFTQAETSFNLQMTRELEFIGFKVFLPQRYPVGSIKEIFDRNLENLLKSKMMIAICDGPDADSGTSWEVGHFYLKGKIYALRTDIRKSGDDPMSGINLMISQSADIIFTLPSILIDYLQENKYG